MCKEKKTPSAKAGCSGGLVYAPGTKPRKPAPMEHKASRPQLRQRAGLSQSLDALLAFTREDNIEFCLNNALGYLGRLDAPEPSQGEEPEMWFEERGFTSFSLPLCDGEHPPCGKR